MNKLLVLATISVSLFSCINHSVEKLTDEQVLQQIFQSAEKSTQSYQNLKYLTTNFQQRLACYPQGIEAARWTKKIMEEMSVDNTFLQEAKVMNWERGNEEAGYIKIGDEVIHVNVCALGRGIGTKPDGLTAEVVEVEGIEGLENLTKEQVKGKIIFFNKAMNPELENPFQAYSESAGQRFVGPIKAAEYGAVGTVIRSLTTSIDEFPHTGTTRKAAENETVPSVSIATKHANLLSKKLKENPNLRFYFKTNCRNLPDTVAYNAIGELTGTEYPNKFITVGGHLDSWDNSPGAHDDGGGCMQAIEVLRIFQEIGYKPKHSVRAVMFIDEEISQGGGLAYLEQAKLKGEKHVLAIESDRGVTEPRGFTIDADSSVLNILSSYNKIFEPYNITFKKGYGGVDIAPLKELGTPLLGLEVDPTHYFDWHHSANDTFDHVNRKEMQKGAAAMAALIYLVDNYGLE